MTAQRREEKLHNVPIAVTALTAASIEARGITNINDIAGFAPNVTFVQSPGAGPTHPAAFSSCQYGVKCTCTTVVVAGRAARRVKPSVLRPTSCAPPRAMGAGSVTA